MTNKTRLAPEPTALTDLESALASLTIDDLAVEDEPSRVLEGVSLTPESIAGSLMGQVVYQINRRIKELDDRDPGGMNRARLAELMGVSKPQVSRLLKAQKNTTFLTVAKAALALGLTDAVLKLIPAEAVQQDEVKAFVESEEGPWWPLTTAQPQSGGLTKQIRSHDSAPPSPSFQAVHEFERDREALKSIAESSVTKTQFTRE